MLAHKFNLGLWTVPSLSMRIPQTNSQCLVSCWKWKTRYSLQTCHHSMCSTAEAAQNVDKQEYTEA